MPLRKDDAGGVLMASEQEVSHDSTGRDQLRIIIAEPDTQTRMLARRPIAKCRIAERDVVRGAPEAVAGTLLSDRLRQRRPACQAAAVGIGDGRQYLLLTLLLSGGALSWVDGRLQREPLARIAGPCRADGRVQGGSVTAAARRRTFEMAAPRPASDSAAPGPTGTQARRSAGLRAAGF